MKRCWLGLILLLLLLTVSLAATAFMTRIHEEMVLDLQQSAQCALLGDWENAQLFLTRVNRSWTKWDGLRSCLADHTPLEEIEADLAALETYRQAKEATAYRALCAALEKQIAALGQAHEATWKNLF